MDKKLIMTPGPTEISKDVREAMALEITNPDLDLEFFDFYKDTTEKFQELLKTQNEVFILSGEGILGLEAACATLTEKGDKVLALDNGFFGRGFGEFAEMYGADVTYLSFDYRRGIDIEKLEVFLKTNHNFKYATLVHCETPSGLVNPIDKLCPILKKYGLITVVDAVASTGGEAISVDEWDIDILIAGSQKCLSAAPGLTIVSVSDHVFRSIDARQEPIHSFYCNLALFRDYYKNKEFPYTQPISNIYSLKKAVDIVLSNDYVNQHALVGTALRKALVAGGLKLYPQDSYSNTATAIILPEGICFKDLYETMKNQHHVLIAGAYGDIQGKVFRIGHMGHICDKDKLYITLKALEASFNYLGFQTQCNMA
ncbi:MAG: alanine--glyoxylate aminotransferase family protein, partial [Clostridia bacterium]|nr:alanine--glyoxylate aminotransferase family protein [Clostridia bacterium]